MTDQTIPNPDPFLNGVYAQKDIWIKPTYPDLENPQWLQMFGMGGDIQKQNLARAWLWVYSYERRIEEVKRPNYQQIEFFERNIEWIRQIQPYVSNDYFTQDNLGDCCGVLAAVLSKEPDSPSLVNEFWFGTDERRLALILESERNQDVCNELLFEERIYNRLWEALASPQATDQHHEIVAWNAIEVGLRSLSTSEYDCYAHSQWRTLGWLGQYRSSITLDEGVEKLQTLKKFIQAHNPQLAVNLLTRMFDFMIYEQQEGSLYTYDANLDIQELSMANVYDVLGAWLPQYQGQWRAAKGLGMTLTEVRGTVLNNPVSTNMLVDLPVDIVASGDPGTFGGKP